MSRRRRFSSTAFYRELVRGTTIGHAVAQGRSALALRRRAGWNSGPGARTVRLEDWFLPHLYQRGLDEPLLPARPPRSSPYGSSTSSSVTPTTTRARRILARTLSEKHGLRVWLDKWECDPGVLEPQCEVGIRNSRFTVVAGSKKALNSKWVEWEIKNTSNSIPTWTVCCPLKFEAAATAARPRWPALGGLHRSHERCRECRARRPADPQRRCRRCPPPARLSVRRRSGASTGVSRRRPPTASTAARASCWRSSGSSAASAASSPCHGRHGQDHARHRGGGLVDAQRALPRRRVLRQLRAVHQRRARRAGLRLLRGRREVQPAPARRAAEARDRVHATEAGAARLGQLREHAAAVQRRRQRRPYTDDERHRLAEPLFADPPHAHHRGARARCSSPAVPARPACPARGGTSCTASRGPTACGCSRKYCSATTRSSAIPAQPRQARPSCATTSPTIRSRSNSSARI
jgi:hypothetical protein